MNLHAWLKHERDRYVGKTFISLVIALAFGLAAWLLDDGLGDLVAQVMAWMFGATALLNLGAGGAVRDVQNRLSWKEVKIDEQDGTGSGR